MEKLKVLELFAGTRSIGKVFEERGHEVYSIEWDEVHENIDWNTDIGEVTAQDIIERFGHPDVIWASPDCTSYSIAGITHHRRKEENGNLRAISDYGKFCDKVNAHVVKLIKELNPMYYFIENPRAGMRKMDFVQDLPRHTTTYCNYNDPIVQELIFSMDEKKCPCCGTVEDIEDFYTDKVKRNGFSSICSECNSGESAIDHINEKPIDKDNCAYCKCSLDSDNRHLDYIISLEDDGVKNDNNTQYICNKCNDSKKGKSEKDWLKKERMKPTDIWNNHPNHKIAEPCKNGSPCHISAPRGSTTGTQGMKSAILKSVIPAPLCNHIADVCEEGAFKPWEEMNIAELEHRKNHLGSQAYEGEYISNFTNMEIGEIDELINKLKEGCNDQS